MKSAARDPNAVFRRADRAAFTLTEVIVAIGIISLVGFLLIPGMQSARRTAMTTKGTSNMQQLAKAQLLYAQENDGKFTALWSDDNSATWQQRLYPYVGITAPLWDIKTMNSLRMDPQSIFNVPDSTSKASRATGAASIGVNGWIVAQYIYWNYRLLAVPVPSRTILLCEQYPERNADDMMIPPSTFNRGGRTRMIVAFCDGHVESLDLTTLAKSATNRPGQPNLWNWWMP